MARKIIWSPNALGQLLELLEFWRIHNGSNKYSHKLERNIHQSVSLLSQFPELGKNTQLERVRVLVFNSYNIYYEIQEDQVEILLLLDGRSNIGSLELPST